MNILTTEQLFKAAPSLFTRGAALNTSARYQPIATSDIIDKLLQEGFYPTVAKQSASQNHEKKPFAKHMVRFRHRDYYKRGDGIFPELVLINSHDGLSSYRLMAGIYRQICTNGLIAGNNYDEVRIRHQGNVVDNVIEGTYQILETSQKMLTKVEQMKICVLSANKILEFSTEAHALRFGNETNLVVDAQRLLIPRRYEDRKCDLFTVFNIVQENLIKGGIPGYRVNEQGQWKRIRSREIKAIDNTIKLNRELWSLAEKTLLSCN